MVKHNLALLFGASLWVAVKSVGSEPDSYYGTDVSFPMLHPWEETHNYGPNPANVHDDSASQEFLDQRQAVYHEFMEGCRSKYQSKGNRCDDTERERIAMTRRQAHSMVNYTDTGFKKIKAPPALFDKLRQYWETHKDAQQQESWPAGNIYTNHWKAPTHMVSVEDRSLRGGGFDFKQELWDEAKETLEEWTGMELQPTSLYGIRVYQEGAILSPHVDRLPLVSSCIVNVAQDVDEPWPLEVIDRQGNAVNVTMEPGDMVLYESGSLIHGRPFPLNGRFFANIFIHFEPTGKSKREDINDYEDKVFPPYIVPGSDEDAHWRRSNPGGWKLPAPAATKGIISGTPKGHALAAEGDLKGIHKLASRNRQLLTHKDENGWQPIHEAARAGHLSVMQALIEEYGADKNARTHDGQGNSPLNLALLELEEGHPVLEYLASIGAEDIEPEL